jgi:hypothetical protein
VLATSIADIACSASDVFVVLFYHDVNASAGYIYCSTAGETHFVYKQPLGVLLYRTRYTLRAVFNLLNDSFDIKNCKFKFRKYLKLVPRSRRLGSNGGLQLLTTVGEGRIQGVPAQPNNGVTII